MSVILMVRSVSRVSFSPLTMVTCWRWYLISVRMSWSLFYTKINPVITYLKVGEMPLDRDGLTVFIICAIGRTLTRNIRHDGLKVDGALINDISVRVKALHDLLLVASWPHVALVGYAAGVSVTDGYHLIVSVTSIVQLELVDRVPLRPRSTYDIVPVPLQVRVVVHAACRGDDPLGRGEAVP